MAAANGDCRSPAKLASLGRACVRICFVGGAAGLGAQARGRYPHAGQIRRNPASAARRAGARSRPGQRRRPAGLRFRTLSPGLRCTPFSRARGLSWNRLGRAGPLLAPAARAAARPGRRARARSCCPSRCSGSGWATEPKASSTTSAKTTRSTWPLSACTAACCAGPWRPGCAGSKPGPPAGPPALRWRRPATPTSYRSWASSRPGAWWCSKTSTSPPPARCCRRKARPLPLPTEPLRLLYSGTISELNGVWEALALAERLHAARPGGVRLTIIGFCQQPALLAKLRQQVAQHPDWLTLVGGAEAVPHARIVAEIGPQPPRAAGLPPAPQHGALPAHQAL